MYKGNFNCSIFVTLSNLLFWVKQSYMLQNLVTDKEQINI